MLLYQATIDIPSSNYDEMATTCVRIVTWLFPHPQSLKLSSGGANHGYSLYHFFLHILRKTRTQTMVMITTLLLLLRFRRRRTHGFGYSRRRLFITALMIASKTLCDTTYSNRAWVIAADHLFTLQEINGMERQFCREMEWTLTVTSTELFTFIHMLHAHFGIHVHRSSSGMSIIS